MTASPNHFFKFRSSSINFTVNAAPPVTVADGATVAIDGVSAQPVTFVGTTGTLKLDDAVSFTGQVSGVTGSRRS